MQQQNHKACQDSGSQEAAGKPDPHSRPRGLVKRIASLFGIAEKPPATVPLKERKTTPVRTVFPARYIVFSDTDNDVNSVRNTLHFAGLLNEQGELADAGEGITIYHTGDLIDKRHPDLSVVEYWQALRQQAHAKGCQVKLIVGNHEQAPGVSGRPLDRLQQG